MPWIHIIIYSSTHWTSESKHRTPSWEHSWLWRLEHLQSFKSKGKGALLCSVENLVNYIRHVFLGLSFHVQRNTINTAEKTHAPDQNISNSICKEDTIYCLPESTRIFGKKLLHLSYNNFRTKYRYNLLAESSWLKYVIFSCFRMWLKIPVTTYDIRQRKAPTGCNVKLKKSPIKMWMSQEKEQTTTLSQMSYKVI